MTPYALVTAIEEVVTGDPDKRLALYVHIPFCASKCHFCDWVVDVPVGRLRSGEGDRSDYVSALCKQVHYYGPLLTRLEYRPEVVYWGGGTPARLSTREMRMIATSLNDAFDLSRVEEWSMETTPNDLTQDKLETMLAVGVDRISVGVQSFNPYQLRRSGRAHSAAQSTQILEMLRASGIRTYNVDLISGFPGEDLASFETTMERTLALSPPHISIYPYRATPKTVMAMQLERAAVDAHTPARMIEAYELAMTFLRGAGYHEYSHGYWVQRPEHEDRDGKYKYNLLGDKIGFGSGAESIIGHHLLWNENTKYSEYLADPRRFTFMRKFSLAEPQLLTAPVGGALMTHEGLVYERFERLTGLSFQQLRETPYMRRWLDILAECGARYVETDRSMRMDLRTVHRAYINHLAHTTGAGLDLVRA